MDGQTLSDFGLNYESVPILCDNTSAICITKNSFQHSRTKHIEIGLHFIRDHVKMDDVELNFVSTDLQFADIFTKLLTEEKL